MKWVKFRIKTVTDAEDIIISTLYDLGLEGAQIEDKVPLTAMEKEQMFVDILPDGPEDDGIAYLSFFVEEKEDGSLEVAGEKTTTEAVLADVKQELEDLRQFMDIGEGSVVVDETEDIDWINNWKQYFHQFYIDDILVIPSWENIKPEDTDKMVLHIEAPKELGHPPVQEAELTMAKTLINAMVQPFQPEQYHDEYKAKLWAIINKKIQGKEITAPAENIQVNVIDIMEALQQSLAQVKSNG